MSNKIPKIQYRNPKGSHSKYTFDFVKKEFENRGYILLSDENEFQNTKSKLRYICTRHKNEGEQTIDFSHLYNSNRGCYYCGRERTESSRRIDIDYESDKNNVESN